jgi:acylglycerol lipase
MSKNNILSVFLMKEFYLINKKNNKINILEGKEINIINGIIIHIHGLGSHFQNLFNSLDEFENRDNLFIRFNYKSFALEFHGHGKSEGDRCKINSFDDLIDDLETLINHLNKILSCPIFLFAESMGCAVCLKYCILRKNNIKGLIFLAPMIGIDEKLKPNILITKILTNISYYLPSLPLITSSNNLSQNSIDNLDFINAKNKNVYTYHGYHKLSTGRELINVSNWINENGHLLDIPIIIFHGLKDTITNPLYTKKIFDSFHSKNKKLHLLDDGFHCLLIESKTNPYLPGFIFGKIIRWLLENKN